MSSGVPSATTLPPSSPPSGPDTITQSAFLIIVEIVFNYQHSVPEGDQLMKPRRKQLANVLEVQPGRRLIEDVQCASGGSLRKLFRQLDSLRLAA